MDFTLLYERAELPATPAATATASTESVVPPVATALAGRTIHWWRTQGDLTVSVFFDPFPLKLGSKTTYGVVLTDAAGQPVSNATVKLVVTGGMSGMEGEHDEDFHVAVPSQSPGLYVVQAAPGASDLVLTGITVSVRRDTDLWTFVIPSDELSPR